ncbi:unnamed protein product [Rhizopus stolonifer]
MNFEYYADSRKEAYDDSSSDDEMDFEAPSIVYGKLIELADANSVMNFDNPDIKNEAMPDAPELLCKCIKRMSVPRAAKATSIPRSTAYELKKSMESKRQNYLPFRLH